jgi:hypothetical protein
MTIWNTLTSTFGSSLETKTQSIIQKGLNKQTKDPWKAEEIYESFLMNVDDWDISEDQKKFQKLGKELIRAKLEGWIGTAEEAIIEKIGRNETFSDCSVAEIGLRGGSTEIRDFFLSHLEHRAASSVNGVVADLTESLSVYMDDEYPWAFNTQYQIICQREGLKYIQSATSPGCTAAVGMTSSPAITALASVLMNIVDTYNKEVSDYRKYEDFGKFPSIVIEKGLEYMKIMSSAATERIVSEGLKELDQLETKKNEEARKKIDNGDIVANYYRIKEKVGMIYLANLLKFGNSYSGTVDISTGEAAQVLLGDVSPTSSNSEKSAVEFIYNDEGNGWIIVDDVKIPVNASL